jgi:glycogen debranching enzyme
MTHTLHNRIDLTNIPFTDRGSRILLFRHGHQLYFRLAERWAKWEEEVGHYRKRVPIISEWTFLGADGQPLTDLEAETYPDVIHLTTPSGTFDWTFLDTETLLVRLPAGRFGITFNVYAERGAGDFRGGWLRGNRNAAYTTNARLVENTVESIGNKQFHVRFMVEAKAGDTLLLNITPRIAYRRAILPGEPVFARAKAAWNAWFEAIPPVLDEYRAQYEYAWWIMRAGLINTRYYFTREALLPSKIHYVGVWQWDQVFHALAYRHVDTQLAEDQLRIFLDHQRDDGMLPDAIHDEGLIFHLTKPVEADVTKPPLMAWAALKLYEQSANLDFLAEIYQPVTRWDEWWTTYNRSADGLCEYRHPFSSGLDDSPLWDQGMPVVSPDLNSYLVIEFDSLARIAELLGDTEAAKRFRVTSDALLNGMIAHLWDDDSGIFRALHDGKPLNTLTPLSLLPLHTGRLPAPITERLAKQVTNESLFWTPHPLSTVAASDAAFDRAQMWRGPVWINMNYFVVEALKRNGLHEQAAELRRKTLALVTQHNDIYEYYDPITGERPPKAAPMFGWSAALFIELAIDETRWRERTVAQTCSGTNNLPPGSNSFHVRCE